MHRHAVLSRRYSVHLATIGRENSRPLPCEHAQTGVPRSRNHQKREFLSLIRSGNAEPKIETLANDLITLNCGTHSLGLIYEFLAKQFGEARGREEFIKYLSGEWSRDWVQAAAARVAEEQPNWSPPMPAPVRISNEDRVNAGILISERNRFVKPPCPVQSLVEHSAAAVHP